jgi:hypothetical protein
MHIGGLLAVTVIPSSQQSSLLEGCWHLTSGLQTGSQGGGHAGAQGGGHTGGQTGLQTGAQGGGQTGGHTGAQTGGQIGLQTGGQGCGQCGGHTGSHAGWHVVWHGSSQQFLSAQPENVRAESATKSNEVSSPSCFLINDSFVLSFSYLFELSFFSIRITEYIFPDSETFVAKKRSVFSRLGDIRLHLILNSSGLCSSSSVLGMGGNDNKDLLKYKCDCFPNVKHAGLNC